MPTARNRTHFLVIGLLRRIVLHVLRKSNCLSFFYQAFGLNQAEITLIEQETKYEYGEW